MVLASSFFEPHPYNFGKLDIFLRCSNDISIIFWISCWFQTYKKALEPSSPDESKNSLTRLPLILIVSPKRFNENQLKVTKRVYTSLILETGEITFYLKSVVKHSGDLGAGHYKTAWNMETLWVITDDSSNFQVTEETPTDGYLFFY